VTPALIPVREAAGRLGVTVQRVHQLIGAGRITAHRPSGGTMWFVPLTADGTIPVAPGKKRGRKPRPEDALRRARDRGVKEEQIREALDGLRGEGVGPSTF
jgi:excisionase family DNA binding protein